MNTTDTRKAQDLAIRRQQILTFAVAAMTTLGLSDHWITTICFDPFESTISFSHGRGGAELAIGLDAAYPDRFEVGTQSWRHSSMIGNMTWDSAVARFWELSSSL